MKKLISLQLDEELLDKLKVLSQNEDRSVSSIIRVAVKKYVDGE